jgi:release factor glutamine methyltransferase
MPARPSTAALRAAAQDDTGRSAQDDEVIDALLRRGMDILSRTSESPRADAMLLLAHALRRERAWIVAHCDARATEFAAQLFVDLCAERAAGTPLAYVLGTAGFYGREFVVDSRVLVPRPETEHLIDEALAYLRVRRTAVARRTFTLLDVGTGSGAIACTLAAEDSGIDVDATDVSPRALELARINAQRLNVAARCRFHCGRFAQPVAGRHFDAVLANLPYVPTSQLPAPPNPLAFEPQVALDGGADGLDAYREFLGGAPALMRSGGLLLLEAAPAQMPGLVRAARAAFAGARVEVGADFAGSARYLKVVTPAE